MWASEVICSDHFTNSPKWPGSDIYYIIQISINVITMWAQIIDKTQWRRHLIVMILTCQWYLSLVKTNLFWLILQRNWHQGPITNQRQPIDYYKEKNKDWIPKAYQKHSPVFTFNKDSSGVKGSKYQWHYSVFRSPGEGWQWQLT